MRGGKRSGAGRPPESKSKRTLARTALTEEALKVGITPLDLMLKRMRELDAWGDDKSRREACKIVADAEPYHPSEIEHANRQEKSQSIAAWLETYGPIVAGLPTKVEN